MAKTLIGIKTGNNSVAKEVSRMYVGVNGFAKRVLRGYIGVNGRAALFYEEHRDPVVIFQTSAAGTHTLALPVGIYEFVMIGGGGKGGFRTSSTGGTRPGASIRITTTSVTGGCGGTMKVKVRVTQACTATIVVPNATAAGSGSTFDTYVTGIPNVTDLRAGGGVSQINGSATGTNVATGSAIIAILEDNVNAITVKTRGVINGNEPGVEKNPNINYPENTALGAGGGRPPVEADSNGGPGFIKISRL